MTENNEKINETEGAETEEVKVEEAVAEEKKKKTKIVICFYTVLILLLLLTVSSLIRIEKTLYPSSPFGRFGFTIRLSCSIKSPVLFLTYYMLERKCDICYYLCYIKCDLLGMI